METFEYLPLPDPRIPSVIDEETTKPLTSIKHSNAFEIVIVGTVVMHLPPFVLSPSF